MLGMLWYASLKFYPKIQVVFSSLDSGPLPEAGSFLGGGGAWGTCKGYLHVKVTCSSLRFPSQSYLYRRNSFIILDTGSFAMSSRRLAPRASRMTKRQESCKLLGFSETKTKIRKKPWFFSHQPTQPCLFHWLGSRLPSKMSWRQLL